MLKYSIQNVEQYTEVWKKEDENCYQTFCYGLGLGVSNLIWRVKSFSFCQNAMPSWMKLSNGKNII